MIEAYSLCEERWNVTYTYHKSDIVTAIVKIS